MVSPGDRRRRCHCRGVVRRAPAALWPLIFRGLVNNQLPAALAALAVLAATPMICVIVMSDAPTEPTRRLVLTRRDLAPARADLRRGDDFTARR
jgi:hypothetical protein